MFWNGQLFFQLCEKGRVMVPAVGVVKLLLVLENLYVGMLNFPSKSSEAVPSRALFLMS